MTADRRLALILIFLIVPLMSTQAELWNNGPVKTYAPEKVAANDNGQIQLTKHSQSSIWLSLDTGNTWNCLDGLLSQTTGRDYYNVTPFMVNDSVYVFLCQTLGQDFDLFDLIVTEDYGSTFNDRTPAGEIVNVNLNSFTVHLFEDNSWLFETERYVYYTSDAGLTWDSAVPFQIEGDSFNTLGLFSDPTSDNTYFAPVYFINRTVSANNYVSKVYFCEESPGDWTISTPFIDYNVLLDQDFVHIYDFLPLSNGNFLAAVNVRVDDDSWDTNNIVISDDNSSFVGRSGGDLRFTDLLFEDNSVGGRIYAKCPDNNSIYVSNNYGQTWSELELNGIPEFDYFSFKNFSQSESGSTLFITIDKQGIYKSNDHGVNWVHVPTFDIPSYSSIYTNSSDLLFSNNDTKWYRQPQGSDEVLEFGMESTEDLNYLHGPIMYAHGDTIIGTTASFPMTDTLTYHLVGSYDGGQSWESLLYLDFGLANPLYNIVTGDFAILRNSFDGMMVSDDFCQTWQTIPYPTIPGVGGWSFSFGNYFANNFYAYVLPDTSDYYDVYYYRLGSSADWHATHYPDQSDRTPVLIPVPSGLYGLGRDRNVYFSNNYNWQIVGQLPETEHPPLRAYYLYNGSDDVIFALLENSNEILLSEDSGQSWRVMEMELPGNMDIGYIHEVSQDPVRDRIWLTSSVGIFWYPLEDLLDAEEGPIQLQPAEFDLFTAYPNPFNASTRIRYNLTQPGNVKLDVYDITGRLVKTLQNTHQPAGIQSVFFDGTGLASGSYFIRLNTGMEVKNRKITLVK